MTGIMGKEIQGMHGERRENRCARAVFTGIGGLLCGMLPLFAESPRWSVPQASVRKALVVETFRDVPYATATTTFFLDDRYHGFSLFTADGQSRDCRLLERRGSRFSILFEAYPGETLYLYPTETGEWPPAVEAHSSGLLHRARTYDGHAIQSIEAFQQAWAKGDPQGARFEEQIFLGYNPFGPNINALHRFDGFFRVTKPGEITFCIASTDASFLLIDNAPVAAWPGNHAVTEGLDGSKSGKANLAPGNHIITFLHANSSAAHYEIAAMILPGETRHTVIPPERFTPAVYAKVGPLTDREGHPQPEFIWEHREMFSLTGGGIYDHTFESPDKDPATRSVWTFQDGACVTGRVARHLFFSEGPATVNLTLIRNGTQSETRQTVCVMPRYGQSENDEKRALALIDEGLRQAKESAIQPAGYAILIQGLYHFLKEREAEAFGEEVIAHLDAIPDDALLPALDKLALGVQQVNENYALAERCFKATIARSPSPHGRAVAALHYAGLLTLCLNRPQEARDLLKTIRKEDLQTWEPRLYDIYMADTALVLDDYATAQNMYAAIPPEVPILQGATFNKEAWFKSNARFFRIQNLLEQKRFRECLPEVDQLEWELPVQRALPQTNLLKARALIGNEQPRKAIVCLQRALTAQVDETYTPKLRLALARLYFDQGQLLQARRQIDRIRQESPWTQEELEGGKLLDRINRKLKGIEP